MKKIILLVLMCVINTMTYANGSGWYCLSKYNSSWRNPLTTGFRNYAECEVFKKSFSNPDDWICVFGPDNK